MNTLNATTRRKVAGLLEKMGASEHPGERDAFATGAHRLVKNAGLSWQQVLTPPPVEKKLPELGTWRSTVAACLEKPGSLRAWELAFLRDLPQFRRLSVKQRYVLNEIAGRVLGQGGAA